MAQARGETAGETASGKAKGRSRRTAKAGAKAGADGASAQGAPGAPEVPGVPAPTGAAAAPAGGLAGAPVHVGLFDFTGTFRAKRLPGPVFDRALAQGWHFIDALPYWMPDETCFEERGFRDEPCTIRPDTLRAFPVEPGARLAIADYAGASSAIAPRVALEAQVQKAAAMGLAAVGGFEFETILLAEDGASLRAKGYRDPAPALTHNRCWSGVSPAADAALLAEIDAALLAAEIALEHRCMELGPGCLEYTLGPSPLLRAADDASLFKMLLRAEARKRGLTASFMAQLDDGFPGLCGHVNISVHALDGAMVCHDATDPQGLSASGRAFLGGIVALTPDLMAMFAPSVNSYRRLRPGNWAPRTASWGIGNYSCGVRVVSRSPEETRFELRLPGADAAPHMTALMALAAGLWGMETGADPGPPVEANARTAAADPARLLPTSLEEAAQRLRASETARALFGERFVEHYAARSLAEAAAFRAHVSAFERARYLETL